MSQKYKFPMVRKIEDSDEFRNVSVEVDQHIEQDGEDGNYEMTSSHECWTGAEWMPITNRSFHFYLCDAFAAARSQVESLGGESAVIESPTFKDGMGWDQHYFNYLERNFDSDMIAKINSEKTIQWNLQGGRPSSHMRRVIADVVNAIHNKKEPKFPGIDFNNDFIAKQKAMRLSGGDATLGGVCNKKGEWIGV